MKKVFRILSLVLTLTMLFSAPVYAGDALGSGNQGGASSGSQDLSGKDGFLASKSGYIVYTSDANGNATSDIVAFTWNGQTPYTTSGASMVTRLETRFGQSVTRTEWGEKAPWGYPCFTGSSGTGLAIKNWLLNQDYGGFEKGMDYVMAHILKFSEAQILDWYADPNNRLNVEPFIYGGVYFGSVHTGRVLVGSTTIWAKLTTPDNWGSRYTHGNLPNSMYHDIQVYPSYPVPSDVNSKHDSGTILSNAYGIVTVMPVTGKQIVKVYKTDGVVDNTSYSFTDTPVNVKDEGSYKVKKWNTSKQKTKAKSTKADYPEVTAGCELVQSGSGPATVDMQPEEKAIFVLLEREKPDASPVLTPDAIRAHEL